MKFHAIVTIVDDKNNVITRLIKDEERQFEMPKNNVIIHDFYIGSLSIPEGCEHYQMFEEGNR